MSEDYLMEDLRLLPRLLDLRALMNDRDATPKRVRNMLLGRVK